MLGSDQADLGVVKAFFFYSSCCAVGLCKVEMAFRSAPVAFYCLVPAIGDLGHRKQQAQVL